MIRQSDGFGYLGNFPTANLPRAVNSVLQWAYDTTVGCYKYSDGVQWITTNLSGPITGILPVANGGSGFGVMTNADPTGVADCAAALTAAIAGAVALGGNTVYLGPGHFKLLSAVNHPSHIRILGAGRNYAGTTAPTQIVCGANGAFSYTSTVHCPTIQDLSIYSVNGAPGAALGFGTATIVDLRLLNVQVQGMARVYDLTAAATIVCGYAKDCVFQGSRNPHVDIGATAITNAMSYENCRFESAFSPNSVYKNRGVTNANTQFINCVFEGAQALYAVDLGDNSHGVQFRGCHFEANCANGGGGPYNLGADIKTGFNSSVIVDGCYFGFSDTSATNFHNIDNNQQADLTTKGCRVNGAQQSGYKGFILQTNASQKGPTCIGNNYVNSAGFDYLQDVTLPVRLNDSNDSVKWGFEMSPIVKHVTTTDATPTLLLDGWAYSFNASEVLLFEADVIGADSTGAVYYAQKLRSLVTADSGSSPTIRGTINETAVASGAQTAAFGIIVNGGAANGIKLTVTGIAATTIRWVARIKILRISA